MNKEIATIKIQSVMRGFLSRKKTNSRGASEGKEIEIYLPLSIKKINGTWCNYNDMVGNYKTILCTSDFFNIQIDFMNFSYGKLKIPEIVTMPFRSPYEKNSNLPTEEEIDQSVSDFISLVEDFVSEAVNQNCEQAFLSLDILMQRYNKMYPRHPLSMESTLRAYLANPTYEALFSEEVQLVVEHQDVEIGLAFEPGLLPQFDFSETPRTEAAAKIISNNLYITGHLLIHVQKTLSLPIEKYNPRFLAREKNPAFHNTPKQLVYLNEARNRAEQFIEKYPLPRNANHERVLGLLTVCVEQILTVVHFKDYVDLHEKADRPVLSIRHLLHYVKINICNKEELLWFRDMFYNHRQDIDEILCKGAYTPDYRNRDSGYGNDNPFDKHTRYDVIFDLFGDFANGQALGKADIDNPLPLEALKRLNDYGITSWEKIFNNHVLLSGRTHLRLQKVNKELYPLFEVRRIGLMTPNEFRHGQSRVHLNDSQEDHVGCSI